METQKWASKTTFSNMLIWKVKNRTCTNENIAEFKQTKKFLYGSEYRLDLTEKSITETKHRVEEITQNSYQRQKRIQNIIGV